MRFVFKTSYGQDLALFRDGVQRNTYIALFLAVLVLPLLVPEYVGDISLVFVYVSQDWGMPWIIGVGAAVVVTAASGVLVGLPALRMTGVYLSIATLAFALIIQEIFTRWDAVTGGLKGKAVAKAV